MMSTPDHATPYIISLEIENNQYKLIQQLRELDVKDFQLIDVRNLTPGLAS
jgi:hypothetical protein